MGQLHRPVTSETMQALLFRRGLDVWGFVFSGCHLEILDDLIFEFVLMEHVPGAWSLCSHVVPPPAASQLPRAQLPTPCPHPAALLPSTPAGGWAQTHRGSRLSTLVLCTKLWVKTLGICEHLHLPCENPQAWGALNREFKNTLSGFPGNSVVKNPPAKAGDTGSIPGLGRSHMPESS